MTTITLDPASRAAMLAGAYAARHSQREVSEAEIEGLARACLDSARPEAVLAKLALDVAINDGGLDWPEAFRREALRAYGLMPVGDWCDFAPFPVPNASTIEIPDAREEE